MKKTLLLACIMFLGAMTTLTFAKKENDPKCDLNAKDFKFTFTRGDLSDPKEAKTKKISYNLTVKNNSKLTVVVSYVLISKGVRYKNTTSKMNNNVMAGKEATVTHQFEIPRGNVPDEIEISLLGGACTDSGKALVINSKKAGIKLEK